MTATNDDILAELKKITALISGQYGSDDAVKAQITKNQAIDAETTAITKVI